MYNSLSLTKPIIINMKIQFSEFLDSQIENRSKENEEFINEMEGVNDGGGDEGFQ